MGREVVRFVARQPSGLVRVEYQSGFRAGKQHDVLESAVRWGVATVEIGGVAYRTGTIPEAEFIFAPEAAIDGAPEGDR